MSTQKKWEIINNLEFRVQNAEYNDLIGVLLVNRNITTKKDIEDFLHPKLEDVTSENVGIDRRQLTKTLKRIDKAIAEKEQIIVFGDYDVDGITASAILWEALTSFDAHVMPYLPHRVEEGYGLSCKGIDSVLEKYPDTKLIITVDNGIVAHEAVVYANKKKIDVIITDHHISDDKKKGLPKAFSIVHTTKLCGAGIAYLLSQEITSHKSQISKEKTREDQYLELAVLGTIADLVPLTGANRTIVKYGLDSLRESRRVGLQALCKEATCDLHTVGVYQIGFIIAPRLNAAGRMESAMDSLRLLCTKDPKRADDLAMKLGRVNKDRQQLTLESATHAIETVRVDGKQIKKLLFVAHETYQEGIIGLIAGKLVEEYYRPAIVVAVGEEKSKGSVRSINGFNIIAFLRNNSQHFINVGGHPMAAGFSLATENIEKLQKLLEEKAKEIITDDVLVRSLKIDCVLSFDDISLDLYRVIQQLAPFGMGNPEPTFVTRDVIISDKRLLGKEGKHLRFQFGIQNSECRIEGVWFGGGERSAEIKIGDTVDIVYIIDENTWNGNTKLQLKIKDIQASS